MKLNNICNCLKDNLFNTLIFHIFLILFVNISKKLSDVKKKINVIYFFFLIFIFIMLY